MTKLNLAEISKNNKQHDFLIINEDKTTYVFIRNEALQIFRDMCPDSKLMVADRDVSDHFINWGNTFDYKRQEENGYEIENDMKFHRLRRIGVAEIPKVVAELSKLTIILGCLNGKIIVGKGGE